MGGTSTLDRPHLRNSGPRSVLGVLGVFAADGSVVVRDVFFGVLAVVYALRSLRAESQRPKNKNSYYY